MHRTTAFLGLLSILLAASTWSSSAAAADVDMKIANPSVYEGQPIVVTLTGPKYCVFRLGVQSVNGQWIEYADRETYLPFTIDYRVSAGKFRMHFSVTDKNRCEGATDKFADIEFKPVVQIKPTTQPLSVPPPTVNSTKTPCKKVSKPGVSVDTCDK